MDLIRKIAKNTFWLVSSEVIGKILSIVFVIILARYLKPIEYGKYCFAYAFVSLFSIIINFGLEPLIIREVARIPTFANKYFINTAFIRLVLSVFSFFVIVVFLFLMGKSYDVNLMVLVVLLGLFPGGLMGILSNLFNAFELMEYPAIISILTRIITVGASIYLLYLGYGALMMIVIGFMSTLFAFLWMWSLKGKIKVSLKEKPEFFFCKEIIKKALPFFTFSILAMYYCKIDMTMLSLMKGDAAVGQYSVSYKVIEALLFIPQAFSVALFPAMSKFYVKEHTKMQALFEYSFKYLSLLAFPIISGIVLLADRIILLLFNKDYFPAISALKILSFALFILFLKYPLGNLFVSIHKISILNISTLCGLCLNVLLNLFFIKKWSFIGASISTVICEILTFSFLTVIAIKYFKNLLFFSFIYKPLLITGFICIYIYFFRELNIFLLISSVAIVYFCLLFLFKVFTKTDKNIISRVSPKFWIFQFLLK